MLLVLLFGLLAIVVVVAFLAMRSQRHSVDDALAPEDQLTDEQFREIEFGEDD